MQQSLASVLLFCLFLPFPSPAEETWICDILPSEQKIEIDAQSGAKLIYATTHPANDWNLYFHDRCFLHDNKMMLFMSNRFGRAEIMAYMLESGELVRLNQADALPAGSPLASKKGDRLYVVRDKNIYQWQLQISTSPQTSIRISEKKLADFPQGGSHISGLAENSDASLLAFAYNLDSTSIIAVYDFAEETVRTAATLDFPMNHLQFHWNRPDLLSVSRTYRKDGTSSDWAPLDPDEPLHARIWFVNINTHVAVPAFYQQPGELATHECWWVNDQITFLGGHNKDNEREEGHVKVLDLKTGDIRIIGAGAWWDGGTAKQLSKVNWWHAAGSPDGKWVLADNWHGILALFDAKTTQKRILTTGHRTYGGGAHPHAGWDLQGKMVEFATNKFGNPDVCIAVLPEDW
ncbi:MAG: hypothetical protein DWQ10_01075 [Calditrichaeota bacterium]|nr:MAG: hypothetical protein DWQ10_01075 [Calditrichota bacterium]